MSAPLATLSSANATGVKKDVINAWYSLSNGGKKDAWYAPNILFPLVDGGDYGAPATLESARARNNLIIASYPNFDKATVELWTYLEMYYRDKFRLLYHGMMSNYRDLPYMNWEGKQLSVVLPLANMTANSKVWQLPAVLRNFGIPYGEMKEEELLSAKPTNRQALDYLNNVNVEYMRLYMLEKVDEVDEVNPINLDLALACFKHCGFKTFDDIPVAAAGAGAQSETLADAYAKYYLAKYDWTNKDLTLLEKITKPPWLVTVCKYDFELPTFPDLGFTSHDAVTTPKREQAGLLAQLQTSARKYLSIRKTLHEERAKPFPPERLKLLKLAFKYIALDDLEAKLKDECRKYDFTNLLQRTRERFAVLDLDNPKLKLPLKLNAVLNPDQLELELPPELKKKLVHRLSVKESLLAYVEPPFQPDALMREEFTAYIEEFDDDDMGKVSEIYNPNGWYLKQLIKKSAKRSEERDDAFVNSNPYMHNRLSVEKGAYVTPYGGSTPALNTEIINAAPPGLRDSLHAAFAHRTGRNLIENAIISFLNVDRDDRYLGLVLAPEFRPPGVYLENVTEDTEDWKRDPACGVKFILSMYVHKSVVMNEYLFWEKCSIVDILNSTAKTTDAVKMTDPVKKSKHLKCISDGFAELLETNNVDHAQLANICATAAKSGGSSIMYRKWLKKLSLMFMLKRKYQQMQGRTSKKIDLAEHVFINKQVVLGKIIKTSQPGGLCEVLKKNEANKWHVGNYAWVIVELKDTKNLFCYCDHNGVYKFKFTSSKKECSGKKIVSLIVKFDEKRSKMETKLQQLKKSGLVADHVSKKVNALKAKLTKQKFEPFEKYLIIRKLWASSVKKLTYSSETEYGRTYKAMLSYLNDLVYEFKKLKVNEGPQELADEHAKILKETLKFTEGKYDVLKDMFGSADLMLLDKMQRAKRTYTADTWSSEGDWYLGLKRWVDDDVIELPSEASDSDDSGDSAGGGGFSVIGRAILPPIGSSSGRRGRRGSPGASGSSGNSTPGSGRASGSSGNSTPGSGGAWGSSGNSTPVSSPGASRSSGNSTGSGGAWGSSGNSTPRSGRASLSSGNSTGSGGASGSSGNSTPGSGGASGSSGRRGSPGASGSSGSQWSSSSRPGRRKLPGSPGASRSPGGRGSQGSPQRKFASPGSGSGKRLPPIRGRKPPGSSALGRRGKPQGSTQGSTQGSSRYRPGYTTPRRPRKTPGSGGASGRSGRSGKTPDQWTVDQDGTYLLAVRNRDGTEWRKFAVPNGAQYRKAAEAKRKAAEAKKAEEAKKARKKKREKVRRAVWAQNRLKLRF